MKNSLRLLAVLLFAWGMCAAQDVVHAVHGTVTKVDSASKTVVVKTADGTEHTIKFADKTVVDGVDVTADAAKGSFHGLKEGSEVVAHYTVKGTEKTAVEVDKVGKDGMKATEGTVTEIDRGAKVVAVKTADGTVQTFKMSDHAVADAGKGIGKGTEKTAKVTVYYTEESGKKIAHFFEKL
jgi:arginine repressor